MSDWKAYAKAGVAAAKTFEMDKSRMLLAMLSDANPADENLEAVLGPAQPSRVPCLSLSA